MTQKKSNFLFFLFLFLISFVYLFIRLYNLPNLIGFRFDQGIHLLETKFMFDDQKIRLIGPMVTSKSLSGRNFFIGANYYYVLGVIGLISHWDPFVITIIFIILELLFYLFFIFFLKKTYNSFFAILTFIFISLSPYLITHSRFFWNPHLLIPLSILTIFCFDKFLKQKQFLYLFLASFFWGFSFACHYSCVFWGIFFIFILIKNKTFLKIKSYFLILIGFILGNLPFFIFEIRHGFYNLKTLLYIFTHSSQGGELAPHYFVFPFLIFSIYSILFIFQKITNQKISQISLILFFTLSVFIQLKILKNYQPLDNIPGWDFITQQKVANLISQNCPANFNVAATMQGDTRFYDLRFLLNIKNCHPLGVENYTSNQTIFLVAPTNRSPEDETVWEIDSFKPFKINQEIKLNNHLIFYELTKTAPKIK